MLGWFDIDREFSSLEQFRRDVDRMLERASERPAWHARRGGRWPRANLYDSGEVLVLELGVPGVKLDDLEISGSDELLTVSGERKVDAPDGYKAHRRERSSLRFARSFRLPAKVEYDKADASLEAGILTVKLPKAPELRPRLVPVRAG